MSSLRTDNITAFFDTEVCAAGLWIHERSDDPFGPEAPSIIVPCVLFVVKLGLNRHLSIGASAGQWGVRIDAALGYISVSWFK